MSLKCITWLLVCLINIHGIIAQPADLILTNGKVFTSDTGQLLVQAIAIKGNKIQAVGSTAAIEKLAGQNTKRVDLKGKTVIPGINDAHDHIGYGAPVSRFIAFQEPMLAGPSLQQVLDSLAIVVQQVPKGTMIQGDLGLRLIEDRSARRAALDKIAPEHPVILNAPWGHGTLLNTKALQLLGISETEKDPVGGEYERLEGSEQITGFMKEYAEFGVKRNWHATLPDSILVKVFKNYSNEALRFGITSVQNMATSLPLEKTISVIKASQLSLRIRVIRFPATNSEGRLVQPWSKTYPTSAQLQVSGMKWILDGTPLERGALMRTSYSDSLHWLGKLNLPADTIRMIINESLKSNEQLLLHISGDSTPALVLKQMLLTGSAETWRKKRVRFEHADGLLPDQFEKARHTGIVAVINPSHFMFADFNHVRVGKERAAQYQPFRSLIEAGIPVAIGSDGPFNPYLNIMFATLHPTNPKEAITREQAVIAYTKGSAYAEFAETFKGTLKEGMLADLTVLSQDIFTIPTPQLPATHSVLTIIDGKIVYSEQ